MENEMELYKKPEGSQKEVHDKYLDSRNVIKRYTAEDLSVISRVDLYFLMDLDQYRTKEIPTNVLNHVAKAKKRQYHPDVSKGPCEAYLLVDKAKEILGDKRLRSIYDSSYFNVTIPDNKIYQEEEFFEVFGNIFREYGRFSVVQPVPEITQTSPDEFYSFFNNYKTNRIYILIDEFYELGKEERLEYTRNNQDKLAKLKNKDILQLKEIIKIAQKRDPRLRSISDQLEEMRLAKQNEWTAKELAALKNFCTLLGKTKKNKWEIIAENLSRATKTKRSVKEVMAKAEELKLKK